MTLTESRLRIVLSISAPGLLLAIAVVMWLGGSLEWVAIVIGVVALALAWFVLFDFATSIHLDDQGIVRNCLARTQTIEWGSIDRVLNPRRRGLVAITSTGKHHILIDRRLNQMEMNRFASQARSHGVSFDGI